MKVGDLNTHELLELDPEGGVIRFAGQRALIVDAVAIGLLKKHLVDSFGSSAARAALTQFGFNHGWRMADAMSDQFEWADSEEWRRAGPRLNALEGLFRLSPADGDALSEEGAMLAESFEAEQHLLHFGRSDAPVCWMVSGLMSGYLSRTQGSETYVIEDRCIARGDAGCHLVARAASEWGAEHTESLRFFESSRLQDSLDVSLRELSDKLKKAEERLRKQRRALAEVAEDSYEPMGIVAKSPAMSIAVDLARRVAPVDSTVLITGASGAGKERIARLIHAESARTTGPFIAVNCGAITETLLESELFGHRRGAFTGASQDRPGLFEAANHGTLLLDELGDVSPGLQVKLLRVLQEREVRRVGDNENRKIDVRVLAATNRDLSERVAAGLFREDLYYRINVVGIHVPSLRDRREDVLALARLLLAEAALRLKRTVSGLSPATADQLLRYEWPGNVRELANAMERAVVLARGARVEVDDLPEEVRRALPGAKPTEGKVLPLEEIEKGYIIAAMELNGGNQALTAQQLGIGTATLYRRLKRYGMIADRAAPTQR